MSERWSVDIPLRGAGGERADLWCTIHSHGCASLPPTFIDDDERVVEVTLPVRGSRPRTVRIAEHDGHARVTVLGRAPASATADALVDAVTHLLRLDEDLTAFYALAARDPALRWATTGAGRLARSATVFEDVVKTLCTTNCAWSGTLRMVAALVEHLGEAAPGAPEQGPRGRAFPTPQAMAAAPESFYTDVARAGYRAKYLKTLATDVAEGRVDLERLTDPAIPDDEVAARLGALPGIGPYAVAHIMMMLGRYSRLVLDSWTRPKYAKLTRHRPESDRAIAWKFRSYGRWAGLAFWLFVTRDWFVPNGSAARAPVPPPEGAATRPSSPGSGMR